TPSASITRPNTETPSSVRDGWFRTARRLSVSSETDPREHYGCSIDRILSEASHSTTELAKDAAYAGMRRSVSSFRNASQITCLCGAIVRHAGEQPTILRRA